MRDLLADGVPIDGVGLQMHITASARPSDASIAANMRRLGDLGLVVTISEMDVRVPPGPAGLAAQRSAYHDVVRLCVLEPRCDGVTFWGVSDAHTWLAGESPLLFDRDYQPKPALFGVLEAFAGS
jgi:GH35 family endo-1,4-beta-xylanase